MPSFAAQLHAFAEKTGQKLEEIDVSLKFDLFNEAVRNTRVADPETWTPPYTPPPPSWKRRIAEYRGGTMKGNWQITTGAPAAGMVARLNTAPKGQGGLQTEEIEKIQPFSSTWLTNNTPYVLVYEEKDRMARLAITNFERLLAEAVAGVQ